MSQNLKGSTSQEDNLLARNETKKTLITADLKIAHSPSDKYFGLLKKSNPRSLMFFTRFGIHTFFLKSPIDVLVLSSKSKVVKSASLNPNSVFFYNPTHSCIIELPFGTLKKSKTKVGDKIKISANIK